MNILKNFAWFTFTALMMLFLSVVIMMIFDGVSTRKIYMEFGMLSFISGLLCSLVASILSNIVYLTKFHAIHALTAVLCVLFGIISWFLSISILAFFATVLAGGLSAFLPFYLRVLASRMRNQSKPLVSNEAPSMKHGES